MKTIRIKAPKDLKETWRDKPPVELKESKFLKFLKKASKSTKNFYSITITGKKGRGKSSLALWLAYHIYGDWDRALNHVKFEPEEVLKVLINAAENGTFTPLIVWDDAAAYTQYAGPAQYFSDEFTALKSLYETVRTLCPVFIYTAASRNRMAPFIREDQSFIVYLYKKGHAAVWRVLKGINYKNPLEDKVWIKHTENIKFSKVPEDVYERYEKRRMEIAVKSAKVMLSAMRGDLVTVKEFAKMVGKSPVSIYRWIREGLLDEEVVKIRGSIRIDYRAAIKKLEKRGLIKNIDLLLKPEGLDTILTN